PAVHVGIDERSQRGDAVPRPPLVEHPSARRAGTSHRSRSLGDLAAAVPRHGAHRRHLLAARRGHGSAALVSQPVLAAALSLAFGTVGEPHSVRSLDAAALGRGRAEPSVAGRLTRTLVGSGTPLSGCEVLVVDPERSVRLGDHAIGEIWVRSPSVAAGYWGKD